MEIINQDHKFWRALGIRLNDSLIRERCQCIYDGFKRTSKIIKTFSGDIDTKETITQFQNMDLHCDCELCYYILKDYTLEHSGY